ncbi:hypothetical protein JY452_18170 [Stenotrophomonas maltophilia]|jgi:uncharacterized lipoprotein YajG|uniref:Lipoprotein n=2 Tax=Stenotrophomonas TaxID=40323 RepID=A0A246KZ06_9GAMM|nr:MULTISPECIES: hypothetical protein [Stenotrophomonas]TGR53349.1 hypothetical protein EN842_09310 [bacterium M00.F.Ca.ET.199.01.1.1]TGT07949.1 hypothetical protein EN820_07805 [bacterium M00.F.Ca.ET.177.01.1.1]TGT65197.1 hypothetical protein EN813_007810 [Mesorhizobium sp. M00.F.Ca.ET.170.01.1.1]TGU15341.1 hypothetical protein EN806_07815 [bacterium M00.F.Ca.ET.163.01.1.1]TGU98054.1 hypothetical protein EN794_011970 [Mesorhizobium sp. M00.F.Ca.ET.151.01.1.1]TGV59754.1 hypothetical protein E
MRILILSTSLLATVLLSACQRPPTPNPEKPPEPQAMARAIQQPLDRAKGVQKTVDDAAASERKAEADATQ